MVELTMPTALETLLSLGCLTLLYYASLIVGFVIERRRLGRQVDNFPGPPAHWLLGNLKDLGTDEAVIGFLCKMAEKYKRVYRLWLGPLNPILVPCHPETVKTMMNCTDEKARDSRSILEPWLGDSLLLSSGQKWFRNRKLLTPAFHFGVLKPYVDIYNKAVDIFMDKLGEKAASGQSINITDPVCHLTLDIILKCAFSYKSDVQNEWDSNPYANAIVALGKLVMDRFLRPHLQLLPTLYYMTSKGQHFRRLLKLVHGTSRGVIAARKKELEENKPSKKYPDFLDILLLSKDEDGAGLSDAEIKDEVDMFLFAGHDTTASAISWILYELSRNTDHQERCRQEVLALLSGRKETHIEWDDLQKIPHLTMCIKEAMRLHTPVPAIGRRTTRPFSVDGITVPKGVKIQIALFLPHRNREVWGDDFQEFRPERFSHEEMKDKDSHAFVPFSAGTRNCIGQNFAMNEIKVAICKILHRFDMRLDTSHKVEHLMEIVMRTPDGIKIFFTPRK